MIQKIARLTRTAFFRERKAILKLRTFDGDPVRGKITTEQPASPEGIPVLVVDGEAISPEEADFFLESATEAELEMLEDGGYDLLEWEE